MSWVDDEAQYRALAPQVADVVVLTTKDGLPWRLTAWALYLLSCGQFQRRQFLENFATTFGPIQAYPRHWAELPRSLVAHEARHTEQFLWCGWWVPVLGWLGRPLRCWAGVLPMALIYGFFPLPMFLAWGRFQLELDAESYAWRLSLQRGWLTPEQVRRRADEFAELLASWAYLKCWPRRWALAAAGARAERVIEEETGRRGEGENGRRQTGHSSP